MSESETRHDPGGKTRLQLLPGMTGDAFITADGRYREWLSRSWSEEEGIAPLSFPPRYWLWIGANPSTAESFIDDPTIRKELHITRRDGGHGYIKTNVMDFRATNPDDLLTISDPCSLFNLPNILKFAQRADKIVLAWGVLNRKFQIHANITLDSLHRGGYELWCLGKTQAGHPKHSLYLKNDTALERFP